MKNLTVYEDYDYLFVGAYPVMPYKCSIKLSDETQIDFDLKKCVESSNKTDYIGSIQDLTKICHDCNVKAVLYPNGNLSFRKLDSSDDELKSCYLFRIYQNSLSYLICIAFEETQPALYKAQLVGLFEL